MCLYYLLRHPPRLCRHLGLQRSHYNLKPLLVSALTLLFALLAFNASAIPDILAPPLASDRRQPSETALR